MAPRKIVRRLAWLLTPVPALVVGALVMREHGVPASRWALNLAGGGVAAAICLALLARSRNPMSKATATVSACAALAVLAATFAATASMGVHRWIPVGPLTLHAGAICLPLLIVALGVLDAFGGKQRLWPMLLATAVAILLLLQPDAAQATAFAAAAFTLLVAHPQRTRAAWATVLLIAGLAAWTWSRSDPLPPVPHVEGMLGLARQSGPAWLVTSIAALAVLPVPFFFAASGSHRRVAWALGVYLCVCIVAPLCGNFPVPLLGFGLSPIVGYFIALASVSLISEPS